MRYLAAVIKQVDKEGEVIEEGFTRYCIIDRAQKNRVVFSSRSWANNYTKLKAMLGIGEDNFNREEFEKKMEERRLEFATKEVSANAG